MIERVEPYPGMKDSGADWLGEVPAHWQVRSLGTLGRFSKGSGGTKADETERGVPCVRYGDLYTTHRFHIRESKACVAPDRALAYTPVRYGDVLFAGSGETLEEIGRSAVNLIGRPAVCGGDVIVFRPAIDVDAEFIGWSTDCRQAASQKARMGRGITVMHIYSSDLKYLLVPLPPLSEQTAIARFLDDADRRIRCYIRAKERLIELLEEERRATIHEAVTGRIDVRTGQPYPAYKDSGVEWLGQVPEHWEVRRLRRCVRAMGGMTPSMQTPVYWGGMIPWVTPKDMKKEAIGDSEMKVTQAALDGTSLRLIDAGGVLIVVRGMILAKRIPVAWTTKPVTINQDMKALTPAQGIGGEFLASALRSAQGVLLSLVEVAGHGTRRLPSERWRSLPIPIPPAIEQTTIVRYLDAAERRSSARRATLARQIDLLREYRTRLIADVVTGKLDVREAAAKLPEAAPLSADGDRLDTIPTGSNPLSAEHDMMKEAMP